MKTEGKAKRKLKYGVERLRNKCGAEQHNKRHNKG